MPRPSRHRRPLRVVADFNTLPELIEHAKTVDGASHILIVGRQAKLYFPRDDGRYDEGTVWQEHGYWHAPAKSARTVIVRLPAGAEPIGSGTQRVGRRAGETRRRSGPRWSDWYREFVELAKQAGIPSAEYEGSLRQGDEYVAAMFRDGTTPQEAVEWVRGRQERRARGVTEAAPAEAPRRRLSRPNLKMTPESALQLAGELSQAVGGSKPRTLPGGYRFSDKNEAAQFTTYSPEYNQKVVCVVSVFEDGSTAIGIFSDEGLSGTATYENIAHFTYDGADIPVMKKDIEWVWETVDGYAESWQEDGGEVDEARREQPHGGASEARRHPTPTVPGAGSGLEWHRHKDGFVGLVNGVSHFLLDPSPDDDWILWSVNPKTGFQTGKIGRYPTAADAKDAARSQR